MAVAIYAGNDHDDGKRFHYEGKISAEGDSIIDGLISGLDDGILTHFTAFWGQQLKYHPATPRRAVERDRVAAVCVFQNGHLAYKNGHFGDELQSALPGPHP
jgi:hypothetical protein